MAKKTIIKAESLAAKTERLMQVLFDAQEAAKAAEVELEEHIEANESQMFEKGNTYTVRYGQVSKTNTTVLDFESKISYRAETVVGLYADADFIKFLKLELGKTAFEGLIEKAKIAEVLLSGDKKANKMWKNMGIIGVSAKKKISVKKINFEE
jgi:hypothetical protein